ncbi:MAG: type II toxin-antitoxin system RelE/ParE family toxin [Actinomycetia bacterium]|nr:type II toxin-antitoxin system RelE/ParE family toxin [Actinomycetes bacterium]
MGLRSDDRAAIVAAMKDVRLHGNMVAHHLRDSIYEVKAHGRDRQFRVLYATEGRSDQVLLALHAITKRTRSVPNRDIELAEARLRDWRSRRRSP